MYAKEGHVILTGWDSPMRILPIHEQMQENEPDESSDGYDLENTGNG